MAGKSIRARALRSAPSDFEDRPIYVIATGSPSKAAIKTYDLAKSNHFTKKDLERYEKSECYPFYEIETRWRLSPGDFFLDYFSSRTGTLDYTGLWRVKTENWKADRDGVEIALVDQVDNFEGFRFSIRDGKALGDAFTKLMKSKTALASFRKHGYLARPLRELVPFFT